MSKPIERRIEALEGKPLSDTELEAEFERLSRLYRDDSGMRDVIGRVASSSLAVPSLADSILAARARVQRNAGASNA